MMHNYPILILVLSWMFFSTQGISLSASPSLDTLFIPLQTQSALEPLELHPISDRNHRMETAYLNQLDQVLHFDLHRNGKTHVVGLNPNRKRASIDPATLDLSPWKEAHIAYLVLPELKNERLCCHLYALFTNKEYEISSSILSGEIAHDRRVIHNLSNEIHKALFGESSIAHTKIVYTVNHPHKEGELAPTEIWEADYDGGNARLLTKLDSLVVTPKYVPPQRNSDPSLYLFVSYQKGQPRIYLAPLSGGMGKGACNLPGNQLAPTVNKQRTLMAFICDAEGNPDLYIQELNPEKGHSSNKGIKKIFGTSRGTQASPTFSPDGRHIALVSSKDGRPRIYLIDLKEFLNPKTKVDQAMLISRKNRENTSPSWSPDGKKIAYSAKNFSERQIWIYDFEKRTEFELTSGKGDKENPRWAPDSLHLVFDSQDGATRSLYMINLNQRESVRITPKELNCRFADWQPTQL